MFEMPSDKTIQTLLLGFLLRKETKYLCTIDVVITITVFIISNNLNNDDVNSKGNVKMTKSVYPHIANQYVLVARILFPSPLILFYTLSLSVARNNKNANKSNYRGNYVFLTLSHYHCRSFAAWAAIR